MKRVYVVATADTKGEELEYLARLLAARGVAVTSVDVGTRKSDKKTDIAAREVAAFHPQGEGAVLELSDRGEAVAAMGLAFSAFMRSRDDVAAILGIGGGGGTSIITAGMRELPYGVPKLMVSTLASGDVAPFVDVSDIIMMPSVTDIAGLNGLSRTILHNAAEAIAGMALHPAPAAKGKPSIGLTMFGVTTPCVTAIAERLRGNYDCLVFHATGTGGRTMEKLADSKLLAGIIDITTTEICDLLFGGVLPATEDRLGAVARTGLPYVGSVGALDMVNFWAFDTVPEPFRNRNLYRHNPNVTLMRTSGEECRADRTLARLPAQPLQWPGPLAHPGTRRFRARYRRRAVLRSASRCRTVRGNRGDADANARSPPHPFAASHQRPRIRRSRGRRVPRNYQELRTPCRPSRARKSSKSSGP